MSNTTRIDLLEETLIDNYNPNSESEWNGIDELDREDDYQFPDPE